MKKRQSNRRITAFYLCVSAPISVLGKKSIVPELLSTVLHFDQPGVLSTTSGDVPVCVFLHTPPRGHRVVGTHMILPGRDPR